MENFELQNILTTIENKFFASQDLAQSYSRIEMLEIWPILRNILEVELEREFDRFFYNPETGADLMLSIPKSVANNTERLSRLAMFFGGVLDTQAYTLKNYLFHNVIGLVRIKKDNFASGRAA